MPATLRHIRIFISSPGDVRPERDALEAVIKDDLQHTLGRQHNLYLEPMRWEKLARPGLGDVQSQVSQQMGAYDIFVGIFWKRFGTPTAKHESGSEEEFRDAYALWEKDHSRPVMMYFCEREANISLDTDPDKAMKQLQQAQKVKAFREEIGQKGLYWTYKEIDAFEKEIKRHLHDAILSLLEKPGFQEKAPEPTGDVLKQAQTVVNIDVGEASGGTVKGVEIHNHYYGDAQESEVEEEDKGALEIYLDKLKNYCQVLPLTDLGGRAPSGKSITLEDVYISLGTRTPEKSEEMMEAKRKGDEEVKYLTAKEAAEKSTYMVLLGGPGSGKSTFVKQLTASLAKEKLETGKGLLPVFMTLRDLAKKLESAEEKLKNSSPDKRHLEFGNILLDQVYADLKTLKASEANEVIEKAFDQGNVLLVLDGLDEVPHDLRERVHEAVSAIHTCFKLKRVIVTCRIRSYDGSAKLDGFDTHQLAPFSEEQIQRFVEAWYEAASRVKKSLTEEEAETRIENLKQAALEPRQRPLAEIPMLMTTMALVHEEEKELPRERVVLYERAVDILMRKWQIRRETIPKELEELFLSPQQLRPIIEQLAFEAHKQKEGNDAADIPRWSAREILEEYNYFADNPNLAKQFLEYVDEHSGLLVGRGGTKEKPDVYSFPHRTFQEYLAGCYLLQLDEDEIIDQLKELAREGEYWSLAIKMASEELYFNDKGRGERKLLNIHSLASRKGISNEEFARLSLWAGYAIKIVGSENVRRNKKVKPDEGEEFVERIRRDLVGCLTSELSASERAEAGRLLAHLGDPREELLEVEKMVFCYVPKGPFLMGSTDLDNLADDDEKPQHKLTIPYDYWISRYPVTVSQYQVFVEAGGYDNNAWWTDAGLAWRKEENITGREDYGEPYSLPNHPVVDVSWYEAVAYCRWLEAHLKENQLIPLSMHIMLPSEAEWEKAARGGMDIPSLPIIKKPSDLSAGVFEKNTNDNPGRIYPWGNEIREDHLNYRSQIGSTSTPGCFETNYSPYGVEGMAGNVYDWTRSKWKEKGYPYPMDGDEKNERENLNGAAPRVVRGGSFHSVDDGVRCAHRGGSDPDFRNYFFGFRLVLHPLS